MSGTLFVVATPIGNLEDISSRALRILREVALIAAEDTRRTAQLLARYGITTSTTSLHQHNETEKAAMLVARLQSGDSIALVSDAGTPILSDPGEILVSRAIEAGVKVEAIPGPSAVLALLAASGLPANSFTFLGFVPIKANDRNAWLDELQAQQRTVIFYESPHRILSTLERIRTVYGEHHIVVGRELTKAHEEVLRGPVSTIIAAIGEPRGEYSLAINLSDVTKRTPIAWTDESIALEFGVTTKNKKLPRRKAISEVARRLGLSPNAVYEAVERHKIQVNDREPD